MQGRAPGEMAPGFYSSQTACPAQSFWEKFVAADRGKGFILPACSRKLLMASALSSVPALTAPSRTPRGKRFPESKGMDMQDPTCLSVPLFASSHAWLSALFFLLCQKLLECKEQGVPWIWKKKKKRPKKTPVS